MAAPLYDTAAWFTDGFVLGGDTDGSVAAAGAACDAERRADTAPLALRILLGADGEPRTEVAEVRASACPRGSR